MSTNIRVSGVPNGIVNLNASHPRSGGGPKKVSANEFALEVFVVHQDLLTGLRAKQTLDNAERQLRFDGCFHLDLWRFELLEDPILREEAARAACDADIVFCSFHGDRPLPAGLSLWFEEWALRREQRPSAVVASVDESERDSETGRQALEYLRGVAAAIGVEVIPHFGINPIRSGVEVGSEVRSIPPLPTRNPVLQR